MPIGRNRARPMNREQLGSGIAVMPSSQRQEGRLARSTER